MDAEFGSDDRAFTLKAERHGKGKGREYVIKYKLSDHAGNTSLINTTIFVDHDKREN